MAFDKHKAPILPLPPNQYVGPYFNQLVRTITSYFNILDSKAGITVESLTSNYIRIPSGEYDVSATLTHNNLVLPKTSFIRFVGATNTFSITGINADTATDGQVLIIYNASAHSLSLTHDDSASSPGNRLLTGGSNVSIKDGAGGILIYSVNDIPPTPTGYWILLAHK